MADLRGRSVRLGIVLALAVVALFDVMSLLQGVRSVRRLRARVTHEVEESVRAARPRLDAMLALGGRTAWDQAAGIALEMGLAAEVEVLDPEGRSVFSRPTVAPVADRRDEGQVGRLAGGRVLTVVAQQGPVVRVLSYLPLPAGAPGSSFRLSIPAPDLEEELGERQQVLLGHVAALVALAVGALLALFAGEREPQPAPRGALDAYEQAMERLRDRGEEMTARHEAERLRLEEAMRESEALARAGELTAGIVHEVRNGLGTIVGYARLVERGGPAADPAGAARSIREECETLETVVRRFTDFVRVEKLHLVPTDLSRLLTRVVSREQRGFESVRTRLAGLDAPVRLPADEELLERAFENVVRNALEAASRGGRNVRVEAVRGEVEVEVRVEDDGPGLAPGHPGEIRPFYTTRSGGLGLGLPLARKIVRLHGGSLHLESREAGGVRVRIRLPGGTAEA